MFLSAYLAVTVLSIHISWCLAYVSYEQFEGFYDAYDKQVRATTLPAEEATQREATKNRDKLVNSTATLGKSTKSKTRATTSRSTTGTLLPIVYPKFNCSEDELPFNIGTYEVPTQRDVVQQIQKTLQRLFNQYQEKALDFLQDIRQATKATSDIEKKCTVNQHSHGKSYKKCVKQVSRKCESIMKSLVTSLEIQRADVSHFIDGTICNVTEMKADPLHLIKTLTMELASLEFALPGFLRLLGACSVHCTKKHPNMSRKYIKKPLRHMTDQDLVVKHFLTKKSYAQLIN